MGENVERGSTMKIHIKFNANNNDYLNIFATGIVSLSAVLAFDADGDFVLDLVLDGVPRFRLLESEYATKVNILNIYDAIIRAHQIKSIVTFNHGFVEIKDEE